MRFIDQQTKKLVVSIITLCCMTLLGFSLHAQETKAPVQTQAQEQVQTARTPEAHINGTINSLRQTITNNQASYQQDRKLLYSKISTTVRASFDTARFAKGVMGKHFSTANQVQIEKFNQALESSLVATLTDGLVGIGDFNAETQKASIKTSAKGSKARVAVKVTTLSKDNHNLKFSLFEEDGQWLIYNAVFDGVDLGKSFRSQFSNALATKGNIDQVISDWQIITQ